MNTINNTNNQNTILGGMNMSSVNNTNNTTKFEGDVNMNNTVNTINNEMVLVGGVKMMKSAAKVEANYGVKATELILQNAKKRSILNVLAMPIKGALLGHVRSLICSPVRFTVLSVVIKLDAKGQVKADIDKLGLGENRLFYWEETKPMNVTLVSNGDRTAFVAESKHRLVTKLVQFQFAEGSIEKAKIMGYEFYFNAKLGKVFIQEANGYREITGKHRMFANELPQGTFKYEFLEFTNGGVKTNKAWFFRQDFAWETFVDVLEVVEPGAIANLPQYLDRKEAVKKIANPGMILTNGQMNDILENVVIMNSKTASGWDGNNVTRASYVQNKYNLPSQADAMRIAEQGRTGGSAFKHVGSVYADEGFEFYIDEVIKVQLEKAVNVVVDGRVTNYYNAKGEVMAQVVGDINKATHVFDADAKKMDIDLNAAISLSTITMAISHISETTLDSQFNESLFVEYSLAGRLEELEEILLGIYREQCVLITKNIFTAKGFVNLEDQYALSILGAKCPTNPIVAEANVDAAIDTLKNMADGIKLPVKLDNDMPGAYVEMMCCDQAVPFGFNVLKRGTVFIPHIARIIERTENKFGKDSDEAKAERERYADVVLSKNPKILIYGGYEPSHCATFDDMESYVDATVKLSDSQKDKMTDAQIVIAEAKLAKLRRILKFQYRNAADGVVYLANDTKVYDNLSGGDNDGDKAKAFFPRFITNILTVSHVRNMDTKVARKVNAKKAKAKVDADYLAEVQNILGDVQAFNMNEKGEETKYFATNDKDIVKEVFNINTDNQMSIGAITIAANKNNAIHTLALKGDLEGVRKMFEEMGIEEGVNEGLGNLPHFLDEATTVTQAYADDLVAEMKSLRLTKEVAIAFTECVNRIFALYQEGAIDATKTGIYLDIIFKLNSITIERLLKMETVGYGIDKVISRALPPTGSLMVEEYVNGQKVTREVERLHIYDVMGVFEDKLAAYANKNFTGFIQANVDKFSYTDENIRAFQLALDEARCSSPFYASSLYDFKKLYNDASRNRMERLDAISDLAKDKVEVYNAERTAINAEFAEACELISNAVRVTLDNITFPSAKNSIDREAKLAELLLGISCSYNFEIKLERAKAMKNRFAYNCVPELVYGYFVGGHDYVAEDRIIRQGYAQFGETITLVKGVSEDGTIVDTKFSGEVVIGDGRVYANKTLGVKFTDERNAVVIFDTKYDLAQVLSKNTVLRVNANEQVDIVTDAAVNKTFINVSKGYRTFTGTKAKEYYVNSFSSIYERQKDGSMKVYTVAFLAR